MSHSAVFRDELWIAAQKEAKIIFEWSTHLSTLYLTKQFPSKDNHAKILRNVLLATLTEDKEHICVTGTIADCQGGLQSFSSLLLTWCNWDGFGVSTKLLFKSHSFYLPFYVPRLFGSPAGKAICLYFSQILVFPAFPIIFFSNAFLFKINWLDTSQGRVSFKFVLRSYK